MPRLESVDWTKWAAILLAALSAGGGFLGSVVGKANDFAVLTSQVSVLTTTVQQHTLREQELDDKLLERVADIDARLRTLEAKR